MAVKSFFKMGFGLNFWVSGHGVTFERLAIFDRIELTASV
jgi:hypothetical protein